MKKKHLVLLSVLVCSFVIYSFAEKRNETKISPPVSSTVPDFQIGNRFILGAMESEKDAGTSYSNLASLKFNTWHRYVGSYEVDPILHYPHYPFTDLVTNDSLMKDISTYSFNLQSKINSVASANSGEMYLLMQRPKLEYLVYGQRSDYQCEPISTGENDLWFYSFQTHQTGSPVPDSGRTVMKCITGTNNPGFVVKRLKANAEQCRVLTDGGSGAWQGDQEYTWHIKPMMRVDTNFVRNNSSDTICKVIIKDDDFNTIMNVGIKGVNFQDAQGNYSGYYREEFSGIDLTINGAWASSSGRWDYKARGTTDETTENSKSRCHADIQIYWYGTCDMWIDYVRVDNETAHRLFSATNNFDEFIQNEANEIIQHQYKHYPETEYWNLLFLLHFHSMCKVVK